MSFEIQGDSIVGAIEIEASPDRVFEALVTPSDLEAWWGAEGMYRTHNWRIDLRVGGSWSCEARSATGDIGTVHGVFLEIDRPRVLSFTWNPSWDLIPATTVRYRLEETPRGTELHLFHSGFAGHEKSQQGHAQGWERVFNWLTAYCVESELAK